MYTVTWLSMQNHSAIAREHNVLRKMAMFLIWLSMQNHSAIARAAGFSPQWTYPLFERPLHHAGIIQFHKRYSDYSLTVRAPPGEG
jgi:hypothetical protein